MYKKQKYRENSLKGVIILKQYIEITDVFAREVLDSRGNPTVEVEVYTDDVFDRAMVPSGASTGIFEAVELRDGDKSRYNGLGVKTAVDNVNNKIADAIIGMNLLDQRAIDKKLCALDGTINKGNLGANAILGVSLACAKTASKYLQIPLYSYVGGVNAHRVPVPMMNILNGGAHADNNIDIQEFMIMPVGADSFKKGLRMCAEVFHTLKDILKKSGLSTAVGDEGGYAPNLKTDEEAIKLIIKAIEESGYKTKKDFMLSIDAASSEWMQNDGTYKMKKSGIIRTSEEMIDFWQSMIDKYPIISIEDGLAEDDWDGWEKMTDRLSKKVQLVGDDLFVTNVERLKKGISNGCANSILVKVNQIGTLTESLDAVNAAINAGYSAILSHRSGETEDTTIADLAVALNVGQIKTGAPSRSERVSKYNQLLRIEQELCKSAVYGSEHLQRRLK